jgi:hypothetical protein
MQAGPAGILSHREVYSSIYNTLRQTFKYVMPYAAHVPSFADTWGWVMVSTSFPSRFRLTLDTLEFQSYNINNGVCLKPSYLPTNKPTLVFTYNLTLSSSYKPTPSLPTSSAKNGVAGQIPHPLLRKNTLGKMSGLCILNFD